MISENGSKSTDFQTSSEMNLGYAAGSSSSGSSEVNQTTASVSSAITFSVYPTPSFEEPRIQIPDEIDTYGALGT